MQVSLKYDSWHRDLLQAFGTLLMADMREFHDHLSKVRARLEGVSWDAPIGEVVESVMAIQQARRYGLCC